MPSDDPLVAFVEAIAEERNVPLSRARAEHLVATALALAAGSTSAEVTLGVLLLEQQSVELRDRGR
ncbi:hypothetical protein [Patulibacter minatonensis]|uniref:hypothetical protein n=1 Tax=Patulibacter minatonensis TaxID=298163 RepID=UPI0012F88346|nr:hypothetical protein [Patulibacter minatonensis]